MTHALLKTDFFNGQLLLSMPFEVKDAFRAVFPAAKWDAAERAWVVADTPANRSKFAAFVESAKPVLDSLLAAQSAAATAEQLAKSEAELTKALEAVKARVAEAQANAARLAPVVEAKKAELAAAKEAQAAAEAAEAAAAVHIEDLLEEHDVADALKALNTFTRSYTKATRAEADKAQYALAAAYNAIKAATGLRIETLRNLANASLNRSDKIAAELRGVTVASLAREAE